MIIAIDGPAGSGKSTIAKLVADRLGFQYLDTGAMYRAVAWLSAQEGIAPEDSDAIGRLAQYSKIAFAYDEEGLPNKVSINEHDVTQAIRTPECDAKVSAIAAIPAVRHELVKQQREIARASDTGLEGRDIGSTVFPDAEIKVFLTATPEIRAKRRAQQNRERHGAADFEQVYQAILERDRYDSSRECSPLEVPKGARVIDTSALSIDEIIKEIDGLVVAARKRGLS